jgi:putative ABC transport system ATP-binding protein
MIEIKDIMKVYPVRNNDFVLQGVSFCIHRGEFVAIMGRSGSGKTTLLNLIGALDKPSSGTITINGIDVNRMNERAKADFRRNQIGFVFQLFNLIPQCSALENVMMPLKPYRRNLSFDLEKRAKNVLQWVGLSQRINAFPSILSGGEQQRVALARSLVNNPIIILADEPTGNLDPETGLGVIQLLRRLNREEGITIMIVTHNEDISKYVDRTLYLQGGTVVESLPT